MLPTVLALPNLPRDEIPSLHSTLIGYNIPLILTIADAFRGHGTEVHPSEDAVEIQSLST